MVLIMYVTMMTVLLSFCSLAVDFGHVVLTQTQIRAAADAAAQAAAQQLILSGTTTQQIAAATAAAQQVALQNQADDQPVTLANTDVVIGNWNAALSPSFSATRTPLNAAQVTVHLTSAGGNAVSLAFAQVMGLLQPTSRPRPSPPM